jgi:hypothetical protein
LQAFAWHFVSRNHALSGRTRIQAKLVEFEQASTFRLARVTASCHDGCHDGLHVIRGTLQVDREANWDDYIILHLYVITAVHHLPFLYCWNGTCHAYR